MDTSLYEAGVFQTLWQSAVTLATGESPGALGSAHPLAAPYEAFPTKDQWITIGAWNQANWERLAEAIEMPELAHDVTIPRAPPGAVSAPKRSRCRNSPTT